MEGLAGALKGWFTEAASCHPLSWFPSVFTLRLLVLLSSHLSFLSICFHSLIDCVKDAESESITSLVALAERFRLNFHSPHLGNRVHSAYLTGFLGRLLEIIQ